MVASPVRLPVDQDTHSFGGSGDAVSQDEHEVQADSNEEDRRYQEYVDDEEATERRASDGIAAEDELRDAIADDRETAGLRLGTDDDGPGRVLVPSKELAGEPHAQGHPQENDAREGQFISRGNLNEPDRNTWAMWMPTMSTMAEAP